MPGEPAVSKGLVASSTPADVAAPLPAQRPVGDATTIPRLPRVYVPRERLWARLEDLATSNVTLVVAPVGAGKTLGVAGWLRASDRVDETTWIHADRTWTPTRLSKLLGAAGSAGLSALPLIVVDDAHELPIATLRMLDGRLNDSPDTLRILLLSRWDLPLSRLVPELMGHLSVLRGDVLRMDDDECVPLIAAHARTEDREVVRAVVERSNGWVAAVVLASRAIAAAPDPVQAARRYAEGDASVADRLASEVFAALKPRERHLLLCVANEAVVTTDDAVHLTHDATAADTLAGLENTGLLVTRLAAGPDASTRFQIHPLLIETVRRELAAGGPDVALAQTTILRAVRLDLARGETDRAFERLVAARQPDVAVRVLAEQGVTLLMRGHGSAIARFARSHPDAVESVPDAWFILALERWLDNDASGSGHWLDRVMADAPDPREPLSPQVACARLLRARMGAEPIVAAIGHARKVVLAQTSAGAPEPLLPLLVAELGMAQGWLGDLTEAELNLTSAVALSRARGLTRLATVSLSHLALVLYMQGREDACAEIATEALERLPVDHRPGHVRARASLAHELATSSATPWGSSADASTTAGAPVPLHIGDPVGRFWATLRDARRALMSGSVSGAQQILEVPSTWSPLPDHLRAILIIERGFLASLAGDQQALRSWADDLFALGARGEAALLTGLRHELESDRKAALAAYAIAQEDVTYSQPASRALALTCEAQLLDVLGHGDAAVTRLREAATLTEVRRNAVPFLGWSRLGTPIEGLLGRLEAQTPTAWIRELNDAAKGRSGIAAAFAPKTATRRERTQVSESAVRPSLSAREREVLNELARGATYADIAAELFVSENTVKTHVSSLYGKLAVARRSEALAVARSLHLL